MKINIKEGIKMKVTPEQSKQVQEIVFKLGGGWDDTLEKDLKYTNDPFLYLTGLRLFRGLDSQCFLEDKDLEVSAEEFIKTKGFTEKPKESKKDTDKDISKKIIKKFIKRIKKEQKNKIYSEVTTYNKCADILKDIVLEVNKGKKKAKGEQ